MEFNTIAEVMENTPVNRKAGTWNLLKISAPKPKGLDYPWMSFSWNDPENTANDFVPGDNVKVKIIIEPI